MPPFGGVGPALEFSKCGAGKIVNNTGKCDGRISSRPPNHEQAVRTEFPPADSPPARKSIVASISRPLRLVVEPVGSGKWRASLDSKVLCTSPSPLVIAARILIGKGVDPACIIEVWHQGSDAWALRGQLGPVAAVRLDGERARAHP